MSKKNQFLQFGLTCLGFKSRQDLIENLYLKAIVKSYNGIDKSFSIENDIRDRFVHDFYFVNPLVKDLLQKNILYINWEKWVFKNENDLGRADLSFALSGLEFIVECKRLKSASKQYIDEGLYRFINLEYSANEDYAGMLGFVVEGDTEKICRSIKEKCEEEEYILNDFSKQKYTGWKYSFNSVHIRSNNSDIGIYHLFFEFTNN